MQEAIALDPDMRPPHLEALKQDLRAQIPNEPQLSAAIIDAYAKHDSPYFDRDRPLTSAIIMGSEGADNLAPLRKAAGVIAGFSEYGKEKLFSIDAGDYKEKVDVAKLLNSSVTLNQGGTAVLGSQNLSHYQSPEGVTMMAFTGVKTGKEPVANLLLTPLGTGKLKVQREGNVDFSDKMIFVIVEVPKKDFTTSHFKPGETDIEQRVKTILNSKKFPPELIARIDHFIALKELR